MQSQLIIRDATLAERPDIAEITAQSYSDYEASSDPAFWSMYTKSTRDTLLHDDSVRRIVAFDGDRIVATVLLCPPYEKNFGDRIVKNPYPEMRLLAVLHSHRDKGIGARIIADCERRTRDDGYDAITLHTTILMQTAKAMYERRGYERFQSIDFEPVPGFVVWGYKKSL